MVMDCGPYPPNRKPVADLDLTMKQIMELPVIDQGHWDNLVYEDPPPCAVCGLFPQLCVCPMCPECNAKLSAVCLKWHVAKHDLEIPHHRYPHRNRFRIWRSRMTVADGAPYEDQITVEALVPHNYPSPYFMGEPARPGEWMTYKTFPALQEEHS